MLQLRTEITTDSERSSLATEEFQNKTLRPLLKFQNEVLVALFKSQLKGVALPDFKMEYAAFIQQRLQKDIATRNMLLGMIIGLMSKEELDIFLTDKTEITKRIMDMLCQRIKDGLTKEL